MTKDQSIEFHEPEEYADFMANDGGQYYHVFRCMICDLYSAELALHLSTHGLNFYTIYGLSPAKTPKRLERRHCEAFTWDYDGPIQSYNSFGKSLKPRKLDFY